MTLKNNFLNRDNPFPRLVKCFTYVMILFFVVGFTFENHESRNEASNLMSVDTLMDPLKITLPPEGKLVNGKPIGKNWKDLLTSLDEWNVDKKFWTFQKDLLHGDYQGGEFHNYCWTKKQYKDFELQALVRMDGKDANSGVCIRIQPVNSDNVPGYQVDMGPGYWGCLWEEKRVGMVQQFPEELANKIVKKGDWNHYYVVAKGHHIQAWLNGVKTIDITHEAGFDQGAIGFQLCHGDKHTILDVKSLFIKEIE